MINRKRSTNVVYNISDELKRRIVEEIESGEVGQCESARIYGISRATIQKWLKTHGKLPHRKEVVEIVMKDEREKIEQLQQALADAELKARLYEKLLELASAEYKTDLKKISQLRHQSS